jgi:hypothetical protein
MPDNGMTEPVEVRRCTRLAEAEELALVLAAVGIPCRVEPGDEDAGLYVPIRSAQRAREQLASYDREKNRTKKRPGSFRPLSHGIEATMVYCGVLFFFFGAVRRDTFSIDWAAAGAAQAGLILDGAWWRAFTALALHADLGHLVLCGVQIQEEDHQEDHREGGDEREDVAGADVHPALQVREPDADVLAGVDSPELEVQRREAEERHTLEQQDRQHRRRDDAEFDAEGVHTPHGGQPDDVAAAEPDDREREGGEYRHHGGGEAAGGRGGFRIRIGHASR